MRHRSCGRWRGLLLMAALVPVALVGCRGPSAGPAGRVVAEQEMSAEQIALFASAERELDSADSNSRQNAAVALLSMSHARALAVVLERMKGSPRPEVRVSMIEAAEFCADHRCFDAVLGAVKDPDDSVKQAAASALSRFRKPSQREAVMKLALEDSATPRQQALLFDTMGRGFFLQATPVLLKGLESRHPDVREAAWRALMEISARDFPPQPDRWQQWWQENRHKHSEDILQDRLRALKLELQLSNRRSEELKEQFDELLALVRSPASSVPGLLFKALSSRHAGIRDYAAFRLASLEPAELAAVSLDDRETYEALRAALRDPAAEVRENVVQLVVNLKGEFRSPLLLDALQDDSPAVLVKAMEAASKELGEAAVERIVGALSDPHPEVREAAANALGKLGSEKAVTALLDVLADKEEDVRWFAVESLRKLEATRAVPQLCELVQKDLSPRVREIACGALAELGQPAAVPALRKALEDENERVRARAVAALQMLARDDFDRMMIIADLLTEHGHAAAARETLRRAIADFGTQPQFDARLLAARRKLAEVLKAEKDFLAAADVYQELEKLTGGERKVRDELVHCLLAAEEGGRIVALMREWLASPDGGGLPQTVDLGCETAGLLRDSNKGDLAEELLSLLLNAAREAGDEKLVEKVQKLRGETPGAEEPETPKPAD